MHMNAGTPRRKTWIYRFTQNDEKIPSCKRSDAALDMMKLRKGQAR